MYGSTVPIHANCCSEPVKTWSRMILFLINCMPFTKRQRPRAARSTTNQRGLCLVLHCSICCKIPITEIFWWAIERTCINLKKLWHKFKQFFAHKVLLKIYLKSGPIKSHRLPYKSLKTATVPYNSFEGLLTNSILFFI